MEAKAYSLAHEGEHYRYLSTLDRCLSRGVPGSMLPAGYNNTHRIVQTPDHIVLQHEMIHDLRIIPLSDHAHIDDRIGLWMGDARAHWEGEVLVVDTRNFHDRGWIATSGAGRRLKGIPTSTRLHVVERYERVSETTIMWPKTRLQERVQQGGGPPPAYELVATSGPPHDCRFTVEVEVAAAGATEGEGRSKRTAEQAAAVRMLERLGE